MSAVHNNLELVPLIKPVPSERPVWMERQWVAIDGLGTARNGLYTTSVFLGSAAKATDVILKVIPGFQLLAGALISYNACRYNLPNSWKELKEVHPEDREGKWVAGLSFANQLCYGSFGPAFLVAGSTAIAGLATSGATSAALFQASEIVATGVLGGICVARGLLMIARSAINLNQLIPFHDDFRQAAGSGHALHFLREKLGAGPVELATLKRRMGDTAAEKVKAFFENPDPTKVDELIQEVDKGIFKQKCKQWLTLSIAFLMVLGGIACLVFSGGITGIAVAAIIGISFTLMEAEWLVFDQSSWFNAIVDKLYTPMPPLPNQIAEEIPA